MGQLLGLSLCLVAINKKTTIKIIIKIIIKIMKIKIIKIIIMKTIQSLI